MSPRRISLMRDDEPVDADVALITDYLTGQLSEAEAETVEDRLALDAAFYEKVSPIIGMYTSSVDFVRLAAELDAAESSAPTAPPAPPIESPTLPQDRVIKWVREHYVLQIAAALVLLVGPPSGVAYSYAAGAAEASLLFGLEPQQSSPQAGTFLIVPPGPRIWVDLTGGSRLRLEPQSRVTYRRHTQWPGGYVVTLKGEAFIDVSDADGVMFVATMHGTAILLPGTYAIRCRLACETMEVAVGARGVAWLHGSTPTEWTYWPVTAGQFAEEQFGIGWIKTTGVGYPSASGR